MNSDWTQKSPRLFQSDFIPGGSDQIHQDCVYSVNEKETNVFVSLYLIVFVPGQSLCGQDEPVLFGSALHDADVVDGEPTFANHLQSYTSETCA